jgi:hypothetical protein
MSSTILFGFDLPGVRGRMWCDAINGPPDNGARAWDERVSVSPEGSMGFQCVPIGPFCVYFAKDGYAPMRYPETGYEMAPKDGAIELRMVPLAGGGLPAAPLSALQVDGTDFRDARGQLVHICEVTNFLQFYRFRRGEDMAPTLYAGFDTDRVTLSMKYVPEQLGWLPLDADRDLDFFKYLALFLAWKRSIGRRTELTILCDMAPMGKSVVWQRRMIEQTVEVASDFKDVAILEDGNEVTDGDNQVDPHALTGIDRKGLLWSSGSGQSGGPVPEPYGTHCTPHLTRESLAKMCADGNFGEQVYGSWPEHPTPTRRPMLTNEIIGAGETDSGSRSTDRNVFKEIARILRSRNGGCFHATDCVYSRALGRRQEVCRAAFVQGFTE